MDGEIKPFTSTYKGEGKTYEKNSLFTLANYPHFILQ